MSARPNGPRARILTLLAHRTGGMTRAEIAGVLELDYKPVRAALFALVKRGVVTMHGDRRRQIPRYTIAGDSLTRPVVTRRRDGLRQHRARAAAILDALPVGVSLRRVTLARLLRIREPRRLQATLRRMIADGQVERVGVGVGVRYRRCWVVRIAV
jgi:predicted ArsR family transcriptional regulator